MKLIWRKMNKYAKDSMDTDTLNQWWFNLETEIKREIYEIIKGDKKNEKDMD